MYSTHCILREIFSEKNGDRERERNREYLFAEHNIAEQNRYADNKRAIFELKSLMKNGAHTFTNTHTHITHDHQCGISNQNMHHHRQIVVINVPRTVHKAVNNRQL